MQTYRALLPALAAAFVFSQSPSFAKPAAPPYLVTEQPLSTVKGRPDPTGKVKVTVTKVGAVKPVWSFTVADPQEVTWSANGRDLALWFQPYPASDPPATIELLVWREGHPYQIFKSAEFGTLVELWDFQFSLDGSRLAFRGSSGGGYLNDQGTLYGYDLAKNRLITGLEDDIKKYRWVDAKTIQYWPLSYHEKPDPKGGMPIGYWTVEGPKLWHLPF